MSRETFTQSLRRRSQVLIVDDSATLCRLIRHTLGRSGYACTEARSGEDALRLLRIARMHLVITDTQLPGGMDGIELIRQLRAQPDHRRTPILVLTAQLGGAGARAIEAGADAFVTKHAINHDLLHEVAKLLPPPLLVA